MYNKNKRTSMKKILFIILLCTAFITFSAVKGLSNDLSSDKKKNFDQAKASEYLNKANNSKNSDEKIKFYSEYLNLNPLDPNIYYKRGILYYYKNDFDNAISDYSKSIELYPDYSNAYYNRGDAYLGKKEYEKAILDYTKVIKFNPGNPEVYNNRGIAYFFKKEYEKAILDYSKGIELNQNDSLSYYNRGVVYSIKGNYDKAILDYTRSYMLNPDYENAYNNLKELYIITKEYNKSLEIKVKNFNENGLIYNFLEYTAKIMINENADINLNKIKKALSNNTEHNWSFNDFEKWLAKVEDQSKKEKIIKILNLIK
jgi:tetratricopeptide (TPR) repeat protein